MDAEGDAGGGSDWRLAAFCAADAGGERAGIACDMLCGRTYDPECAGGQERRYAEIGTGPLEERHPGRGHSAPSKGQRA